MPAPRVDDDKHKYVDNGSVKDGDNRSKEDMTAHARTT